MKTYKKTACHGSRSHVEKPHIKKKYINAEPKANANSNECAKKDMKKTIKIIRGNK